MQVLSDICHEDWVREKFLLLDKEQLRDRRLESQGVCLSKYNTICYTVIQFIESRFFILKFAICNNGGNALAN